jgi:uncharacterized protein YgiM (DUF1202 family)
MSCLKRLLGLVAALALLMGVLPAGLAAEQALYTATADACIMRGEESKASNVVVRIPKGATLDILKVNPEWVQARYGGETGYVLRNQISKVTPVDPVNTPPYGVFKHTYMAVTADVTPVHLKPQADADVKVTLQPGAKLSILDITDGWARIPYWRTYGYVDTRLLKDLTPISPTDTPVSGETPIAAFTSFYKVVETEANIGRMKNIVVACQKLCRVLAPGEELDFNKQIGPYSRANGYFPAPVLVAGGVSLGSGGGTCQVSSTLYNTLLQLPHIAILYRRPHGPAGATYLPHGVDAAVGNDSLNLRIRNDYDFPIRVEASAQDGALFMCVWKQ